MLKSSLCDYGDAYILVNGTKTIMRQQDKEMKEIKK